jgi:general secretion pathway protein G
MNINNNPTLARNKKRNHGFTLVEMLLVVTIIGILAALVIPKIAGTSDKARITAAQADIKGGIKTALDRFEVDNGYYPKTLADLVTRPNDSKNWNGPYLDSVPTDPWSQPYVYVYPGRNNTTSYDLYSIGRDAQDGTADDIGNWTK